MEEQSICAQTEHVTEVSLCDQSRQIATIVQTSVGACSIDLKMVQELC